MLERAESYEALVSGFRWRIPARYNIGVDVCDRHADAGAGTALIHVAADGTVVEHSFTDLKRRSNRLCNVLAAAGLGRGARVGILRGAADAFLAELDRHTLAEIVANRPALLERLTAAA